MGDSRLIKKLRTKSQSAFKELYYKYYKLVFYQAYSVLNSKEDAEDVSQVVFIKFWDLVEDLSEDTRLNQLLSKMAKNAAIDLYRKKSNAKEIFDETLLNSIPSKADTSFDLDLSLKKYLEPEETKILVLKFKFDYSFQEIADDLNQTLGQIQAKYYKALKKLKVYYEEERNYEL